MFLLAVYGAVQAVCVCVDVLVVYYMQEFIYSCFYE